MKMPKATDADKEHFRLLVPDAPGVEVKPMFGQLGAFVNGNMFAGLFAPAVGVKLDDRGRAELEAVPGSGPFGPAERPMGGYVALPPDLPVEEAQAWVARACTHASSFPPKRKK